MSQSQVHKFMKNVKKLEAMIEKDERRIVRITTKIEEMKKMLALAKQLQETPK